MPCDRILKKNQSISERKAEIKVAVDKLAKGLMLGTVKPIIGKQGAIYFQGWDGADRNDVSDACAYRKILSTGSALARAAIAKAEQLAGRTVDKQVIGQGAHAHTGADGSIHWHKHKG